MKPEIRSLQLLEDTRSLAKMNEFAVSIEDKIEEIDDPERLFTLSIGLLGDLAFLINSGESYSEIEHELKEDLQFSAYFYTSYLYSELSEPLSPYLKLLGAASFYLCDLPGSATVMANQIDYDSLDLECEGLEDLMFWLLQENKEYYIENNEGSFGELIEKISYSMSKFIDSGNGKRRILKKSSELRLLTHEIGTSRQLLFGEIISAIIRKKLENSPWVTLPKFSNLDKEMWSDALTKETSITEMWPAQLSVGKNGILNGGSAIIQMQTSAGKTKATELIIRSAFLSESTNLAIIVAPFRALVQEIADNLVVAFENEQIEVNKLSDAFQFDYKITKGSKKQVLVLTPEKLVYVLRYYPNLTTKVGLIIFDEGHQFDSGDRGITYELLLTSLLTMFSNNVQKIIISAVLSNAEKIGNWFNNNSLVVSDIDIQSPHRSIGYVNWYDDFGEIEFLNQNIDGVKGYTIPEILQMTKLKPLKRDRVEHYFPDKEKLWTVTVYLGNILVKNGGVAIFCGKKASVVKLCMEITKYLKRDVSVENIIRESDKNEKKRLANLYAKNLGSHSYEAICADLGILSHHGNTPYGIRTALEYSMRKKLVNFVICTSTLAQGVNIPIRYLIIHSLRQGKYPIKVRDFHNLIGRVGRAGMYTDGNIIFADSRIYETKGSEESEWSETQDLLTVDNTENCTSELLKIFEPIEYYKGIKIIDVLDFVDKYIEYDGDVDDDEFIEEYVSEHTNNQRSIELAINLLNRVIYIVSSVENLILFHCDLNGVIFLEDEYCEMLAKNTLAYSLAENSKIKENIKYIFSTLNNNIMKNDIESDKIKIYSKTSLGIRSSNLIESWIDENIENLLKIQHEDEILELTWPLFELQIKDRNFMNYENDEILFDVTQMWLEGKPFFELLQYIKDNNAARISAKISFNSSLIVEFFERIFGFEGSNIVGAVCEFLEASEDVSENTTKLYRLFQSKLKFGLPSTTSIVLYELGFSDRVIAQDLASTLNLKSKSKSNVRKELRLVSEDAEEVIKNYPKYYQEKMFKIIK